MGRAGRSFMPSALQGLESTNIISAANEVSNSLLTIRRKVKKYEAVSVISHILITVTRPLHLLILWTKNK